MTSVSIDYFLNNLRFTSSQGDVEEIMRIKGVEVEHARNWNQIIIKGFTDTAEPKNFHLLK